MINKKSVAAIINYQGHVLLGLKDPRAKDSLAGKWHIPAGTKKPGETDIDTLVREVYEETRLIIQPGKYISEYTTPKGTLLRWYDCQAKHAIAKPNDDLVAVKWVARTEILDHLEPPLFKPWSYQLHTYFH